MSDLILPIDPSNHTGETEIRDAVAATYEEEGYTGDTYCLSCGAMITKGTSTPKLTTQGYSVSYYLISDDVCHWAMLKNGMSYKEPHVFNTSGVCVCGAVKNLPVLNLPDETEVIVVEDPAETVGSETDSNTDMNKSDSASNEESSNPKTGIAVSALPLLLVVSLVSMKRTKL